VRNEQVRQIRYGNQQHQSGHHEQQRQRFLERDAKDLHAGRSRHNGRAGARHRLALISGRERLR
jgi:hypothetical protein